MEKHWGGEDASFESNFSVRRWDTQTWADCLLCMSADVNSGNILIIWVATLQTRRLLRKTPTICYTSFSCNPEILYLSRANGSTLATIKKIVVGLSGRTESLLSLSKSCIWIAVLHSGYVGVEFRLVPSIHLDEMLGCAEGHNYSLLSVKPTDGTIQVRLNNGQVVLFAPDDPHSQKFLVAVGKEYFEIREVLFPRSRHGTDWN